jgi:hypothetical protein
LPASILALAVQPPTSARTTTMLSVKCRISSIHRRNCALNACRNFHLLLRLSMATLRFVKNSRP